MPKKQQPCANPIFLEILEEKKAEFSDSTSNHYFAFKKAADSIRAYPYKLAKAEDAQCLKYIGPAVVKTLQKGLEERGLSGKGASPRRPAPTQWASGSISSSSTVDIPQTPRKRKAAPTRAEILASPRGQRLVRQARLSHAIPAPSPMDIDIEDPYASTDRCNFDDMAGEWQPLILPAGSYSIFLVMDNRERGGQQNRDGIIQALRKKGIPVLPRALELGDVCWVAKRDQLLGDEYDEVALDIILERKRLDDLCQSLVDKRLHEQKFRLHNSGLSRIFYLIEDYEGTKNRDVFAEQITSMISSTQVVDGFMLKETRSIQDTINYYIVLHEQIVRTYAGSSIAVLPSEIIRRHNYLAFQKYLQAKNPGRRFHTSFDQHQKLNTKSGWTTVRENWAKMLLCVKGLGPEKVSAIVAAYPTPRALWEAMKDAEILEEDARQKAALLESQSPSKGKRTKKEKIPEARHLLKGLGNDVRPIGEATSAKVYNIFRAENYDLCASG